MARKGETQESEQAPVGEAVEGVLLHRHPDGMRAHRILVPRSVLDQYTVEASEPDMMQLAVGAAERMLHDIVSGRAERAAYDRRPSGELKPDVARRELEVKAEELAQAYWAGAHGTKADVVESLARFAVTGELEPPSIGRRPTGDDRAALQQLMALAFPPPDPNDRVAITAQRRAAEGWL